MKKFYLLALVAGVSLVLGNALAQEKSAAGKEVKAAEGKEAQSTAGKEAYVKRCKLCHAADGSGKKESGEWLPLAKTLKLDKPEKLAVTSLDAKQLGEMENVILKGKDKMKGMEDKGVKPEEAKLIVEYVKTLQKK
ncbi:MAG: c-type cytochrome [Pseudomonadota bacterium]